MCYNCGCHMPPDDMGHPDNFTTKTLEDLGKKWGKTPDEAKKLTFMWLTKQTVDQNIAHDLEHSFEAASKAWGQSVDEAKNNAIDIMQNEVK